MIHVALLAMILSALIPGDPRITTHYRTVNPAGAASVRWNSNVNQAPDGSTWWRWQFSSRPGQNFYDVMFWAGDHTLRYSTTNRNCDDSGSLCGDVTSFVPPLGFGPETWNGETRTVKGTSTVARSSCTGNVAWSWTVRPGVASEIQSAKIRTDSPIAHVTVNQSFTGGCGVFSWSEDWWWGTACVGNLCTMGPVQSKGGTVPWTADANHWYMTFDSLTLDN